MPLLGFTKLQSKLYDGSKTQTIRRPRKHPIKVGNKLFIYWKLRTKECHRIGTGVVIRIVRKPFHAFTEEDAILDGFNSLPELRAALKEMYNAFEMTLFDIITWDWTTLRGRM